VNPLSYIEEDIYRKYLHMNFGGEKDMPKKVPMQPEAKDSAKQAKKLRKREQRLHDRLEEAQKRCESAQTRLLRAEVRLQKRRERVERLDGRLTLVRQQLQAIIDANSEAVTPASSDLQQLEATELKSISLDTNEAETNEAEISEIETNQTETDETESETTEQGTEISSPSVVGSTEAESATEEVSVVAETAGSAQLAEVYSEYEEVVSIATLADAPPTEEQSISAEDLEPVARDLTVSQAKDEHGIGNVNEEELEMVEVMSAVELPEYVVLPLSPEEAMTQIEENQQRSSEFASQKALLMSEARAVAENAEQAAQIATMRATHMLDHLEQILDGCHLHHELTQLQNESTTLASLTQEAQHTIDKLVQLSAQNAQEETLALLAQEIERQRQMLAQVRTSADFSGERTELAEAGSEKHAVDSEYESTASVAVLDRREEEIHFDIPASAFIYPGARRETALEAPAAVAKDRAFAPYKGEEATEGEASRRSPSTREHA
jgi:hypothetical protein